MNIYEIRKELSSGKTIYDIPLRVTYYARVSTEKEQQKNSLENQDDYYRDKILSNPNWTFIRGYSDDGITGTCIKKRNDFKSMIEDGRNNKFDLILTKEVWRFARNTLDTLQITRELLSLGKGVYFELDNINTLEQDGELRLTIMASLAQDESRRTSERTKFGFNRSIEKGRVLGNNAIWGYQKNKCKLELNEEEARIVKRIFEVYSTGNVGIRGVSKELAKEGLYSRSGKPLSYSTIRGIIVNPKYKGFYCGKKTEVIDFLTKEKIYIPQNEWITYKTEENIVPQIVDDELWEKCNKIISKQHERFTKEGTCWNSNYLYSKLLVCSHDGKPYWRRKYRRTKGDEYWGCSQYAREGREGCISNTYVATNDLNKILTDVFSELKDKKEKIMKDMIKINKESFSKNELNNIEYKNIEEQINELEVSKKGLIKLYSLNKIDENEFEELNNEYKSKIKKLKNIIDEGKDSEENIEIEKNKQKIEQFFNFNKFELTNNFLREKINKIYVEQIEKNHLKLKIDFKFDLKLPAEDKECIRLELIMCILGAFAFNFTPNLEPCLTISGSSKISSSIEGVTIP